MQKSSRQEVKMFEVTDKAGEMMGEYFKDKEDVSPSVRISLSGGGWSGPALGMVLDEPKQDDEVVKKNGSMFVINTDLLKHMQPVKVDFIETDRGSGYTITSSMSGGGSCGESCSC